MLPKHSRDVVYIVVILVLIGIIVGVSKDVWMIIIVNILVITTGLIYVKLNDIEEKVDHSLRIVANETKITEANENPYVTLQRFAEIEKDECDEDADYSNFDAVRESHLLIAKFFSGEISEKKMIHDISVLCKTKLLMYYLGLESILKANVQRMNAIDQKYIHIGIELLKASHFDKKTATLDFINKINLTEE